jgi:hypothetical protein
MLPTFKGNFIVYIPTLSTSIVSKHGDTSQKLTREIESTPTAEKSRLGTRTIQNWRFYSTENLEAQLGCIIRRFVRLVVS